VFISTERIYAFEEPPSACINSDTDFPEGYSLATLSNESPFSFYFYFLLYAFWCDCTGDGWMAFLWECGRGQWIPGVPSHLRKTTAGRFHFTLTYGTPLNILWHPGATLRALCVQSCPMNLKYDRIPPVWSPKGIEGADFPDLPLKFHSLNEDFLRNRNRYNFWRWKCFNVIFELFFYFHYFSHYELRLISINPQNRSYSLPSSKYLNDRISSLSQSIAGSAISSVSPSSSCSFDNRNFFEAGMNESC